MLPTQPTRQTIGQMLRKRREELGMSIEDVAREIQLSKEYVKAFEEDRLSAFSARVYARGFFKKILSALSVDGAEEMINEFESEWDVQMARREREARPIPENRIREPWITPARLWIAAIIILFAVFIFFFGSRLGNFLQSPAFSLEAPEKESVVISPTVLVSGTSEKESIVTVNGRELALNSEGRFHEFIELTSGLNVLKFIAEDRFGNEAREVRYVLVR